MNLRNYSRKYFSRSEIISKNITHGMTQYLHTGVNDITAANFHKPSCFYFQFEGTLVTHDFLILLPRTHTGSCQLTVSVLKFDTTCKLS